MQCSLANSHFNVAVRQLASSSDGISSSSELNELALKAADILQLKCNGHKSFYLPADKLTLEKSVKTNSSGETDTTRVPFIQNKGFSDPLMVLRNRKRLRDAESKNKIALLESKENMKKINLECITEGPFPWYLRSVSECDDSCWDAARQFFKVTTERVAGQNSYEKQNSALLKDEWGIGSGACGKLSAPPPLRCWEEMLLVDQGFRINMLTKCGYSADIHIARLEALFYLVKKRFEFPSAIQRQLISAALSASCSEQEGITCRCIGFDVVGVAETGSGKTLCYLVPAIHCLTGLSYNLCAGNAITGVNSFAITQKLAAGGPFVFILTPTRELAAQVVQEFKQLLGNTEEAIRGIEENAKCSEGLGTKINTSCIQILQQLNSVKILKVVGDEDIDHIRISLSDGVHVVVGTPGRLKQLLHSRYLSLQNVKFLAVDEVDRLVEDSSMLSQTDALLSSCFSNMRQTIILTATMSQPCIQLAEKYLSKERGHFFVRAIPQFKTIVQAFEVVPTMAKESENLTAVLNPSKMLRLRRIIRDYTSSALGSHPIEHIGILPSIIIFANEKQTCNEIGTALQYSPELPLWCGTIDEVQTRRFCSAHVTPDLGTYSHTHRNSEAITIIHANLSQEERASRMERFRKGNHRILITTDLLARGIDVAHCGLVVNFDMPDVNVEGAISDGQTNVTMKKTKAELAIFKYKHRIGRTGRLGSVGFAVSFVELPQKLLNTLNATGMNDVGESAVEALVGGDIFLIGALRTFLLETLSEGTQNQEKEGNINDIPEIAKKSWRKFNSSLKVESSIDTSNLQYYLGEVNKYRFYGNVKVRCSVPKSLLLAMENNIGAYGEINE